jgi:glycolate oxidase FAD binding subunit
MELNFQTIAHPALGRMVDQIRAAGADSRVLHIQGGNTKAFYGQTVGSLPSDQLLSTADLPHDFVHEPSELVITASGGMPLQALQDQLNTAYQYLPFEPPHFGPNATVGGMVAAGLSGPSRGYSGSVRDHVLGLHLLDGQGQVLQFGGQVIKNVAGYDVSRLMAGSMGQLGVIVQVSLKVMRHPSLQSTVVFGWKQGEALEKLNKFAGMPIPLTASCWRIIDGAPQLAVRFCGSKTAVEASVEIMIKQGGRLLSPPQAAQHWVGLQEHTLPFFTLAADECLWRISVPDSCPPLHFGGSSDWPTLVEWRGAMRWVKAPASAANALRACATAAGGHATLFRTNNPQDKEAGVFTPLSPALQRVNENLLARLDPKRVFNTGRMGVLATAT